MKFEKSIFIAQPVEEVFEFCASRQGFMAHFPYKTQWDFGEERWTTPGEELGFTFKVGPMWIKYIARIEDFQERKSFVDVMQKGPYKYFRHEHYFEEVENGTVYKDVIHFSLGLSPVLDYLIGLPATAMTFSKRHKLMKEALSTTR